MSSLNNLPKVATQQGT